eukprot:scaffold9681_cov103-Skeletonema_dohrnii-CCMP3373.AAC.1
MEEDDNKAVRVENRKYVIDVTGKNNTIDIFPQITTLLRDGGKSRGHFLSDSKNNIFKNAPFNTRKARQAMHWLYSREGFVEVIRRSELVPMKFSPGHKGGLTCRVEGSSGLRACPAAEITTSWLHAIRSSRQQHYESCPNVRSLRLQTHHVVQSGSGPLRSRSESHHYGKFRCRWAASACLDQTFDVVER